MAISDYDHLLIGPDGKNAKEIRKGNWIVKPHKNWLYLCIDGFKDEGNSYCNGTVGEICGNSNLNFGPFRILTKNNGRGIYFYIESFNSNDYVRWAGIAVNGYKDNYSFKDINKILSKNGYKEISEEDYDIDQSISIHHASGNMIVREFMKSRGTSKIIIDDGDMGDEFNGFHIMDLSGDAPEDIYIHIGKNEPYSWTGITTDEFDEFMGWIKKGITIYDKGKAKWFDSIDPNMVKRVNQGDQFFSDALGIDNNETSVGLADHPIIRDIIERGN